MGHQKFDSYREILMRRLTAVCGEMEATRWIKWYLLICNERDGGMAFCKGGYHLKIQRVTVEAEETEAMEDKKERELSIHIAMATQGIADGYGHCTGASRSVDVYYFNWQNASEELNPNQTKEYSSGFRERHS